MRIHVLGASGFIGGQILQHCADRKYQVKGYSSRACNLLSSGSIRESLLVEPDDVVVVASAVTRTRQKSSGPVQDNFLMALRLAEFISDTQIGQVIYLSTTDVYGTAVAGEIQEELPLNPGDSYSCSKLFGEVVLREACYKHDIPIMILRLTGIYGQTDMRMSTIGKLIESAKSHNRINIFGDGEDRRDYVHVNNVCQLIEYSIEACETGVLNVATGTSYSVNQIVDMISELYPKDFSIVYGDGERTTIQRNQSMDYNISLLVRTFPSFLPIALFEGLKLYLKES